MYENSKTTNEYGTIVITRAAVSRIILRCVSEFTERFILTNRKGRMFNPISRLGYDESDHLDVAFDEAGAPEIRVYGIIRFGASITATCRELIDRIRSRIRTVTGRDPISITIVVKGTISKNIVPRHIEVSKYYERH